MKKMKNNLKQLKNRSKIGFMGHIIGGYPQQNLSIEAGLGICRGGADFLEVQFPFSDPTADGPTIESACYTALENGFKIENGFEIVTALNQQTETAILIMTYANIIYKYGIEKFARKAQQAGAQGFIIPDLPPDQDENLNQICREYDLATILLTSPGADAKRIQYLSSQTTGFLYTVTRRGTTGKRTQMNQEVMDWINFVKSNSNVPIAAGLGIQSNEQIKQLTGLADIAVVGSYFVKNISRAIRENINLQSHLGQLTADLLKT